MLSDWSAPPSLIHLWVRRYSTRIPRSRLLRIPSHRPIAGKPAYLSLCQNVIVSTPIVASLESCSMSHASCLTLHKSVESVESTPLPHFPDAVSTRRTLTSPTPTPLAVSAPQHWPTRLKLHTSHDLVSTVHMSHVSSVKNFPSWSENVRRVLETTRMRCT